MKKLVWHPNQLFTCQHDALDSIRISWRGLSVTASVEVDKLISGETYSVIIRQMGELPYYLVGKESK